MTESTNKLAGVKTLGIRVPDALHAQFVLVAKLDGLSLNDACVRGVELYVAQRQSEPDFKARVAHELEEIEREATDRTSAIQALLGQEVQAGGKAAKKATSRSTRGKG